MRKLTLTLLVGALTVIGLLAAPPQSQKQKNPPPSQKTPAPQKPLVPDCVVETIQLGGLTDGARLAQALSSVFTDFIVKRDPQNATTLYVVDRAAARNIVNCKKGRWRSSLSHDELDQIVQAFDSDNFEGVKLNSSFLIHVQYLQPRVIVWSFPHPEPDIALITGSAHYIVVSPLPGRASGTTEDQHLANEVAGIKHDLELLDAQADPAKSGTTIGSDETQAELWFALHTVKLDVLDPREIALKLRASFPAGTDLQVWAQQRAITFLPTTADPSTPLSGTPLFRSANAVERGVLYTKEQEEKQWTAQQQSSSKAKANAPTPSMSPDSKQKAPAASTSKKTSSSGKSGDASSKSGGSDGGSGDSPDSANTNEDTATNNGDQGTAASQDTLDDPPSGAQTQETWKTDHVVRLYHLRQATNIAAAINKAVSKDTTLVTPITEDLLLILPPAPGSPDLSEWIRRAIAILDLPRPKVSIQVWSYQISADTKTKKSGPSDVENNYDELKAAVEKANGETSRALSAGLAAILNEMRNPDDSYFDQDFSNYLTKRFEDCVKEGYYCLGYQTALLVPLKYSPGPGEAPAYAVDHSLSRFLLLLAAAKDEKVRPTIAKMEEAMQRAMLGAPSDFECGKGKDSPVFNNFFQQLCVFSSPNNLHIMRAAVLDFLFHYKWANVYASDFSPYDLQRSAHVLDSLLSPIMDAFNLDVDTFVGNTLKPKQQCEGKNCVASFGQVQVATVSGNKASVVGDVKNYFDITPPVTLSDMLNPNSATSQALGSTLKGILEPKEITILSALANANSQPRITAEVSKNVSLTITPTSLDSASSAELDLDFDVKEDTAPQSVNQTTTKQDLLDRVAEHHVITRVRVDSLKLFQVSSFTMQLTHPQPPVCYWSPLCIAWQAVFGSIPVAGHLFEIHRGPKTKDNRSVAIVRAVIVPTAMDLGLGLRFEMDKIEDPVTNTLTPLSSLGQLGGNVSRFHQNLMKCMVEQGASNPSCLTKIPLNSTPEVLP
ncbi:MAG: hypothetical protein ACRD50_07950 [Candidatus Acidiferrales bacterium]